jgi:hypothetical protein
MLGLLEINCLASCFIASKTYLYGSITKIGVRIKTQENAIPSI